MSREGHGALIAVTERPTSLSVHITCRFHTSSSDIVNVACCFKSTPPNLLLIVPPYHVTLSRTEIPPVLRQNFRFLCIGSVVARRPWLERRSLANGTKDGGQRRRGRQHRCEEGILLSAVGRCQHHRHSRELGVGQIYTLACDCPTIEPTMGRHSLHGTYGLLRASVGAW